MTGGRMPALGALAHRPTATCWRRSRSNVQASFCNFQTRQVILPLLCTTNSFNCLMPSVKIRENEPFEYALRRFKRSCEKAGILAETRKREFYEKPTAERKRKLAAAVKRTMRRMSRDVTKRKRLY